MFRALRNLFLPHNGNDHHPHLLRDTALIAFVLVILTTFFSAALAPHSSSRSSLLSAIYARSLVDLTNADRSAAGLETLHWNSTLEKAAQAKANDMARVGYFAHESPTGVTPWHWFAVAGYRFAHAGENLAVNFSENSDVEEAWMHSPGHRANILDDKYTEVAIATAPGRYKDRDVVFVVQLFGTPEHDLSTLTPLATQVEATPPVPAPSAPEISTTTPSERVVLTASTTKLAVRPAPPQTSRTKVVTPRASTTPSTGTTTPIASTTDTQVLGSTTPGQPSIMAEASINREGAPNPDPTQAKPLRRDRFEAPPEPSTTLPETLLARFYTCLAGLILLVVGISVWSKRHHSHIPHLGIATALIALMFVLLVFLRLFLSY